MRRSEYVLVSALGLLSLAGGCLWMWAIRCSGCSFHTLSAIAMGLSIASSMTGITMLLVTTWHTQRLWSWCRRRTVVSPSKIQQSCHRLGLAAPQVICVAQAEALSFCIGFLSPRIVVSTGLLDKVSSRELTAILAHEQWHQQQRDPLRLVFMHLLRTVLYPLPMIHDLHRAFLTQIEIEADAAAVAYSGRPVLASALYKLLMFPTPQATRSRPAVVTSFNPQASRLAQLLDPQNSPALPFSPLHLIVSLLPFFLLCLTRFIA
jgi:Zn-dependent protease with chaperone function